jgi:cytolysin (calcineurin-like family phosphatase)
MLGVAPTDGDVQATILKAAQFLEETKAEWSQESSPVCPGIFSEDFSADSYIRDVETMAEDTHRGWTALEQLGWTWSRCFMRQLMYSTSSLLCTVNLT